MPDELVRGACELALVVARAFESPRDVPGPVRRYLKMQWLPPAALGPIRRVLDADDGFRARVAEVATEDVIGRPAFLFLVRPEGWDSELAALAQASSSVASSAADEREERSARRKLDAVSARLAEVQRRLDDATAAEAAARAAHLSAEETVASLSDRVDALRHERDDARARLVRAEARIAELTELVAAPVAEPPVVEAPVDVATLRAVLSDAVAAADRLRTALDAAVGVVDPPSPPPAPAPASPAAPTAVRRGAAGAGSARRPVRLPGGMHDDTVEAAEWLVRRAGAVLVVDGYNCTLRDTPLAGLPIAEQRRRLVDALTELASRTQADVEVVFDGADVTAALVAAPRRHIRVTFSPPGTEADELVIARTRTLPVDRPVVVASSDNRVRASAAANGANVISAEQLMAIIRARG